MVIRMRTRIRLFTLMRIRIQILDSKKTAQTLEKVLNRLIFHTFWLVICKLVRIRIRFRIQLLSAHFCASQVSS
jgi:hypothetical protein